MSLYEFYLNHVCFGNININIDQEIDAGKLLSQNMTQKMAYCAFSTPPQSSARHVEGNNYIGPSL